ncbi:MAG: prepilin-type N-terminal cleavage/methylation domain-containing protein [Betaproteobacteria bacterium]
MRRLSKARKGALQTDRCGGFSLIELAVVLLVIALLLGSILVPLGAQVERRQYTETEKELEQVKEALIGFALSNDYLPCPAKTAADGTEDRISGGTTCTLVSGSPKRIGFLPWVTLGVKPADSWSNLYRYSVSPNFTNSAASSLFTLTSTRDILIQTRNTAGTPTYLSNVNEIPAVILSHGKNGFGATSDIGIARATPATWSNALDEFDNANDATSFWSRTRSDNAGATGGVFDDIVVWIPPSILFSRMVAAGRLP